MVVCASTGKSQTVSPFPRVSQMTTTSKGYVSFLEKNALRCEAKSFHDARFPH